MEHLKKIYTLSQQNNKEQNSDDDDVPDLVESFEDVSQPVKPGKAPVQPKPDSKVDSDDDMPELVDTPDDIQPAKTAQPKPVVVEKPQAKPDKKADSKADKDKPQKPVVVAEKPKK